MGNLVPLPVDDVIPVYGLDAHALTQVFPGFIRQLGKEGVEEHEDDGQLIYDGEFIRSS